MVRAVLLFFGLFFFSVFTMYVWKPSLKEGLTFGWKSGKLLFLILVIVAITTTLVSLIQ